MAAARESGAGTGDRSFWAPESADSGKSADRLSRDLGFDCIRSSKVNTYIMHRSTEVLYPLSLEVASNGQPTGTPDPAIDRDDEIAFIGITGSPSYLWRHTGCPGPYGTGCFKLSINQSEAKCKRSTRLVCNLKDASKSKSSKTQPY